MIRIKCIGGPNDGEEYIMPAKEEHGLMLRGLHVRLVSFFCRVPNWSDRKCGYGVSEYTLDLSHVPKSSIPFCHTTINSPANFVGGF